RLAVERLGEAETGAAARRAPGDECLGFHEPLDAHLCGDLVVERGGLLQIPGAQCDVADHRSFLAEVVRLKAAVCQRTLSAARQLWSIGCDGFKRRHSGTRFAA